ncbi:hypothetical protein BH09ACT13_BH09ACT13_13530 [soil metagenome]
MQTELPTGTVTFLFTDVEESTRLLAELGTAEYAEALQGHRVVIRAALATHGGSEVDTQGDAFFCAFASARAAVACAETVQSSLAAGPIRVRIGIHTGEALVVDQHYVGMDVHRAARIGACGHGGQVVISPATVGLLEPKAVPLKELGAHRLKDLSAPVTLYQLGDAEFAPLKTLFRTNLPIPATPVLGREAELEDLAERASSPAVRLLTLVGAGGTGKTRFALQLAAELADDFPDGVRWVPLASLHDPSLVASAVAQVLEVEEGSGESLADAISSALAAKRVLLLLDNCEHVLDAAAQIVSPLLRSCPEVLVLTTSREPLAVAGEHVYDVQPLLSRDAISLFDARARAAGAVLDSTASRSSIEKLCARLDNLPLAVELAAARAAQLPPAALLERLSSRVDLLKGPRDADERQRTLRSTIAWSHDLLDFREQELFRRLAVFSAGAALEVVETVCDADVEELLSLVAKSLVRQTERAGGEPRYWMLETIREFAADMLDESGEAAVYRDRHLDWFTGFARDARSRLVGPGSTEWLGRLEDDLDNLRVASRWALEQVTERHEDAPGRYGEAVVALTRVLGSLHLLHGRYAEAEDALRGAIALEPERPQAALFHAQLGRVLRLRGFFDAGLEAHLAAERCLGPAAATDDEPWWHAWLEVKLSQANHHYYQGNLEELAAVIAELESEVDRHGTPEQGLDFLHVRAQAAFRRERYVLSEETEELVREIHRRSKAQEDVAEHFVLGFCLLWRDKLPEAQQYFQLGLDDARRYGDALIEVRCLVYDMVSRRKQADVDGVRMRLAELDAIDELHGYEGLLAANHAWVAYRDGDHKGAIAFADRAFAQWQPTSPGGGWSVFDWTARFPLLAVELARERSDAAFEHAKAMLDPSSQPLPPDLATLLEQAVGQRDPALLVRAIELARPRGYT